MDNGATIQSLTTTPGLGALARRLAGVSSFYHEPERLSGVASTVQNFLKSDPSLKNVKLQIRPGTQGGYYPGRDLVTLGVVNPSVVGHELAHAHNLRKAKVYGKVLQAAQGVASINNTVALPAMLAIRALVGDPDTRREVFNILSGVSAAIAAPGLVEEMGASVEAVKNAPDKLQAVKSLIPAFLTHAAHALKPTVVYQAGKLI
jgi:hypothetical protein